MTNSIVDPLSSNALRAEPFEQIDNFQSWAKACISHYIEHGTLHQVFQIAHSTMIFESLWTTATSTSENWLDNTSISALYVLKRITSEKNHEDLSALNEELLSIVLCIREYYVINGCFEPHSCLRNLGEVWREPEHPPKHYLAQFKTVIETLT